MMGDKSPPEPVITVLGVVTDPDVTVDDEGDDEVKDKPEVVTAVGIDVTMVTKVGADPTDDEVSFLLTETGTDPVVVEDREPLGNELTKMF